MKHKLAPLLLFLPLCPLPSSALLGSSPEDQEDNVVTSQIITSASGDLTLAQTLVVDAPVSEAWKAYATKEGWTAWASPQVEFDLRTGGTIRTHYDEDAVVGDPGTITMHILNYVPERLITLQAELDDHFPQAEGVDNSHLMEVTVFESLGQERTRISSYGVGYRDEPEHKELLNFFIPANEGLYQKLKAYLEG